VLKEWLSPILVALCRFASSAVDRMIQPLARQFNQDHHHRLVL
jgi:hypothetical protein